MFKKAQCVRLCSFVWIICVLAFVVSPSVRVVAETEEVSDIATVPPPPKGSNDDMKRVAATDSLELLFHEETAEFAIKEKQSGKVWYSNPIDRDEDPVAAAENKSILNAQLIIDYFSGGQTIRLDTHKDSVMKEQFEFEQIENGIKVTYTMGNASKGINEIPKYISEERFQTMILDKIEDEKGKKDIKKRFKYIEKDGVYERRDAAFSKIHLERTLKIFDEIGYTQDERAKDQAEYQGEEEENQGHPFFTVPLFIQIEGDQLKVQVKGNEIEYNPAFEISTIQVLPFFGAANMKQEGYMFVPDGSGALIHLNNEKHHYPAFTGKVYGKDEAIFKRMDDLVAESIRLPVFGMKQGNDGFLGVIETGDSLASIQADVSGRLNMYNSVSSFFTIKDTGEIRLSGGDRTSTISVVQTGEFKEDLTVRYFFLNGEEANYAGMAQQYQQYLIEQHELTPLNEEENIPFYLEITGSIWKRSTFLGVPYKAFVPLTTFTQAKKMVNELADAKIDQLQIRYVGWFNKGVHHTIPTKIHVDRKLGGEKGFQEFADFLAEKEICFYPDVAFTNVYQKSSGFRPTTDAARYLTKKVAEVYPINPATFRRDRENRTPYYLLSPAKLPKKIADFLTEYEKYHVAGLSLRDIGNNIHSDFNEKNVMNREQTKHILIEQLSILEDKVPDLLVVGGNAYSLPYVHSILEAPQSSSGYLITDRSIPFYQMVVHGYVDYAGIPMNLRADQNMRTQMLQALETGSNIYFSLFYEDPSIVKDTEFNTLFSANFDLWKEEAIEIYHEVNDVLKHVRTKPITSHEELAEGVYETTYGEGYSVIVNYNDHEMMIDQMTIEPLSYQVRRGE